MADYKDILKNSRMEAGKLMTEEQIAQCNVAIHAASVASGVAGAIPISIADAIPISAAQITMVIALGRIFDQEISSAAAKALIAPLAATFAGRSLIKLIPIAGWGISAAVAAVVTEAIGWTIAVDMANSYRKEYSRRKNAQDAANAWAKAEEYKQAYEDDFEDEADDFDSL